MRRVGALAALAIGLAAPAHGQEPPEPVVPVEPFAAEAAAPLPPDLRGDWRMDLWIVSHARIPVLGTTTILAHTIYTARVDGTQAAPVMHTRPCKLNPQTTKPIATTSIPQPFVDNLPLKDVPIEFSEGDGGWTLRGDMQPQDVGWDRARYRGKPGALVPQEAEHPAVVDHEADGHPGATIHLNAPLIGTVEVYVTQTAHTILHGTWDGADVLTGSTELKGFGQRSIGASNRIFVSNPDIELDAAQSRFRLARVPDGTSCAALAGGVGAGPELRPKDVKPKDD